MPCTVTSDNSARCHAKAGASRETQFTGSRWRHAWLADAWLVTSRLGRCQLACLNIFIRCRTWADAARAQNKAPASASNSTERLGWPRFGFSGGLKPEFARKVQSRKVCQQPVSEQARNRDKPYPMASQSANLPARRTLNLPLLLLQCFQSRL